MADAFQVDLRGVVDLLSHHLYAGPQVYVRELLQNAVDALTTRATADADGTGHVTFTPADVADDGRLHVVDTGTGLTGEEVRSFLTTIGASSKRDELGLRRDDQIGQFGIGLLSCFLVTDEIELVTVSASGGGVPVHWRGRADGSFTLVELGVDDPPPLWLDGDAGTHVALAPRTGEERWLSAATVTELVARFGALLDHDVRVVDVDGTARRLATGVRPWDPAGSPLVRRDRLLRYARDELGVEPFDVVDLAVPAAGLTGVAVISDEPSAAATRLPHRVHVRRMLVADDARGLAPDWAFFARCAVDASELRPTASREALYEDDLLAEVRASIGDQLRSWLLRLASVDPARMARFLERHHLGVKALARTDDELLEVVLPFLRFETTLGSVTLETFRRTHGVVHYTRTVDEFRQVAAVAAAQGVGVVNGGYVHDAALVERLPVIDPVAEVRPLTPDDVDAHVEPVDDARLRVAAPFLATARAALDGLGVDLELRTFEPSSLPALFLDDRERRHRRDSRRAAAGADPLWAGLLDRLDDTGPARPRLLLNDRNPVVARLVALGGAPTVATAVEAVYCQALLLGHHPMRPADTAAMSRSFLGLLEWALPEARP